MGMFDSISVEVSLPGSPPFDLDFQTKSFDNNLDCLTIKKDMKLWRVHSGWLEEHRTEKQVPSVVTGMPGTFTFYDYSDGGEWWEYMATLDSDGNVSDIKLIIGPHAATFVEEEEE